MCKCLLRYISLVPKMGEQVREGLFKVVYGSPYDSPLAGFRSLLAVNCTGVLRFFLGSSAGAPDAYCKV